MNLKFGWILTFLLLILCENYPVFAQKNQIRFEHLTRESGLSQSTVYSIIQDKYGFIWIGTADGLNRYDGYSVKKYFHEPEKHNSLSNNRIYNLLVDRDGDLWIATLGGGLNKYRLETDDFIAYKNDAKNPQSISSDLVMSLFEDEKGIIWIGTAEGGLNRFDKKKGIFKTYKNEPGNQSGIAYNTIIAIAKDKQGNLWLAFNKMGLDRFDVDKGVFTHFKHLPDNQNSISSNKLNHVFVDSRGLLWISSDTGLDILKPENGLIKRIRSDHENNKSLRINDIHYVFEDKDQNIWIGTYAGLSLLRKENYDRLIFENYYNNPLDLYSLSNDLIRCIYQERSGIMWVGNFSNGVDIFDPHPSIFTSYYNEPGIKPSLSSDIIRNLKEDRNGILWIATFGGGFNRFDPQTEDFQVFKHSITDKNSLSMDFVNAICLDENDNLWIGTYGGGLDFYNQKTKKFRHFVNDPDNSNSLSSNYIRSMMFDKSGYLWIASSGGGLNRFNPKTEEFVRYLYDENNPLTISENRVMGLFEDNEGNIWVGSSSKGLNKYVKKKNIFEHFRNDPENPKSISSDRIYCIYQTRDEQSIWIGTGNGLNRFNKNDSSFTKFTKKDGFLSDVIVGILEDENKILWISTMDGLYKFDPNTAGGQILKVYEDKDGLRANEFTEGAYLRGRNGKLYFGGIKGFSVFDPSKTKLNPTVPPIYIVDFLIANKSVNIDSNAVLKQNIIVTNELVLNYSHNVFSFEFSALNYKNSKKNRYMYKMDGFDEDWITTDSKRRFVTYTNLDPDNYTFMLKASNDDGIWNEKIREIKISIKPPYWKTWWFRLFLIILGLAILLGIYLYRITSLQKHQKILEHTVAEKTAEILHQKEELESINEKLGLTNTRLQSQSEELESKNLELKDTNLELLDRKEELEIALNSLKEAQSRLIQSEKMASLGILAAGVAHEINNPLNFIQGGITWLENYFNENPGIQIPQIEKIIGGIHEGVTRAAAIVTSLNQYSRSDNFLKTTCNMHSIIDNCLVMLQSEIKYTIDIRKVFMTNPPLVECNEGKLHQAILNILSNAVHSIINKGTITITTWLKDKQFFISILDNGSGISKENLSKIFDPFFTTKDPGKGTGLGLSITYNIIKEHAGSIDIESQPGKGTNVLINLPVM